MTDDPGRPTALFLSAHLDDVAFSCGGTVAALRRQGWKVAVVTAFTASVPNPSGFALACQLDKGLGPDVDYLAIRRDEDAAFGRAQGVDELLWLDLPEAPHRGYGTAAELFADLRPEDTIVEGLTIALRGIVDRICPRLILAPQAVGGHVDHRQLIRAATGLRMPGDRIAWYRDLPYAEKYPKAVVDSDLPNGLIESPVKLTVADMEAKLKGCDCYATQVPFQFGGSPAMRSRLLAFRRLGKPHAWGPILMRNPSSTTPVCPSGRRSNQQVDSE